MAKGFKHGAGGGTSLNFKVVGNPQPSNPKENIIWVNTDVEITGWIFSATQPTGSSGMVWFPTDTLSPAEFNALKKNGIIVHPLAAKQYIAGTWEIKETWIYIGSAWTELSISKYLYNKGKENYPLTGKMSASGYSSSSGAAIEFTKNADHLYASPVGTIAVYGTPEKIDLTKVNTIYLNLSVTGNTYGIYLCADTDKDVSTRPNVKEINGTGTTTVGLDVSALTGNFYVYVAATSNSTVKIHEMWFE